MRILYFPPRGPQAMGAQLPVLLSYDEINMISGKTCDRTASEGAFDLAEQPNCITRSHLVVRSRRSRNVRSVLPDESDRLSELSRSEVSSIAFESA